MPHRSAEVPRRERPRPPALLPSSHIQVVFTQLASDGVAQAIAVTDVVSWIVSPRYYETAEISARRLHAKKYLPIVCKVY